MRSQHSASLSELSQLRYYFQTWSFGQLQHLTPRRSTRGVTNPTRHSAAERSSLLFQLYLIACSNSLTALFSLLLLAWLGLHDFYDKWFAMLGPKRQTAPVTLCLHSKGEYQSLHCGRRSSWEQNLLPTLFFLYRREEKSSSVSRACLELITLLRRDESLHPGIIGNSVVIFKRNDKQC